MTLPTTAAKPSQLSIKSFFQPRQPNFAHPPTRELGEEQQKPQPQPVAAPLAENVVTSAQPNPPPQTEYHCAPTFAPTNPHIPPEATIRPLQPTDVPSFKRINSIVLPVAYPDPFYDAALRSPLSRVITWTDPSPTAPVATPAAKVVGAVVCRLDSDHGHHQHLYIQSLALLSPFRGHGLATAALDDVVLAARKLAVHSQLGSIYAHVWTENEEGLRWYASRGFVRETRPQEGYYTKLRPGTAYIVRRDLTASANTVAAGSTFANTGVMNTSQAEQGKHSHVEIPPSATAEAANLPPFSTQTTSSSPPKSTTSTSLTRPEAAVTATNQAQSFQNRRSEMEWNDLPQDMVSPGSLAPPRVGARSTSASGTSGTSTGDVSEASSRSSSATGRKKKERRVYPSAAFGS